LLKSIAEKADVDPDLIKNTQPSTKSTRSTRKSASKRVVNQLDSALKTEVVTASRSFLDDFPGLLLKAITKKVREEHLVTKWADYIGAKLNDESRAIFTSLSQPAKETCYKEMANTLRPGDKKVIAETVTDQSEDEAPVQRKRKRLTTRHVVESDEEDEEHSDRLEGSTMVEQDPVD
jgi:hypothetical protein